MLLCQMGCCMGEIFCCSRKKHTQYNFEAGTTCLPSKILVSSSSSLSVFGNSICHTLLEDSYIIKFNHIKNFFYGKGRSPNNAYTLLKWSIINLQPNKNDLWLEFGVAAGFSINVTSILRNNSMHKVYGFDSFLGLPEDWRNFPIGSFSQNGIMPPTEQNIKLVPGLFNETLPGFLSLRTNEKIGFVNMDMDLYEGARYVLRALMPHFKSGSIIHFHDFLDQCDRKNFLRKNDEIRALYDTMNEFPGLHLQLMPFNARHFKNAAVFKVL